MDGLDADGQRLLQVLQDVAARAVWGGVVQQLLERLQLNQYDHVLQEVAHDVVSQVWSVEELREVERK